MTSTLASMRHLSVSSGTATFDVAVPLATRLGDLLESGGFPPGSRLVDASGAPLPEDDLVGEAVEDGAIVYVVDSVHTPTLTRVGPAGPTRSAAPTRSPGPGRAAGPAHGPAPTRAEPARATESASAGTAPTAAVRASAQIQVDAAAAGARTRSATRRGRGRTGNPTTPPGSTPTVTPPTAPSGRGVPPGPAESEDPGAGRHGSPDDARPTGRRAVVPPAVRRSGATAAPTGSAGGLLPPPPGPVRSPVPLPPGGTARRGAHAAADDPTPGPTGPGTALAPRRGAGLGAPAPPRIAPPPTGATGRGSVAPAGGRRAADTGPDRPARPRGGPAEVALSPGAYAVSAVLAAATAGIVALASRTVDLPVWSDWAAGAVLVVAAVVAAIRPGSAPLQRWGRVVAALCAGCGGFVLATTLDLDLDVAAVSGFVVAAAVAMLGRTSAVRGGVFEPWVTVTAVASGAVAVDVALAVVLSWPAYVAPLLLAGVSPLVMRALPAAALDVPDEQLIDTERLSNTSWSARTGVRRRRRALRQATVELITRRAAGIVAAGSVTIAVFVTVGYGIAVFSTMPGALSRWALLAEGVLLLGGLGLAGRTVRDRFGKRVLRLAAAAVTVETGYHLTRQTGPGGDVALVAVLVAVALGVVAVSTALDVGWRSLRLSRLADFAEGFCVVFALPAALLAVDVIAVLRQAVS